MNSLTSVYKIKKRLLDFKEEKIILSMITSDNFKCISDWKLLKMHNKSIDWDGLKGSMIKKTEDLGDIIVVSEIIPNANILHDFLDKYMDNDDEAVGYIYTIKDFEVPKENWNSFADLINDDFDIIKNLNFKHNKMEIV